MVFLIFGIAGVNWIAIGVFCFLAIPDCCTGGGLMDVCIFNAHAIQAFAVQIRASVVSPSGIGNAGFDNGQGAFLSVRPRLASLPDTELRIVQQ
jgi:hypothetical protein